MTYLEEDLLRKLKNAEARIAELERDKARLTEALNECLETMALRQESNADAYDRAVLQARTAIDAAMQAQEPKP